MKPSSSSANSLELAPRVTSSNSDDGDDASSPPPPLAWVQGHLTLEGHSHAVDSVVFSPDGTRLASHSRRDRDETVRVWDAVRGKLLHVLEGHTKLVQSVVFSRDGTTLVSSSWDQTVRVWDVETGKTVRVLKGHTSHVTSAVLSLFFVLFLY